MASETFAGPVDFLAFGFETGADLGPGLQAVLDRVEQGIIEILDIELIGRANDGTPSKRPLSDFADTTDFDLTDFDGAESGILDSDDLQAMASALEPGQFALALVYEDRSLAVAAGAWSAAGGAELFAGGVDITDLEAALEEGNAS